jgi:hypothetical protein
MFAVAMVVVVFFVVYASRQRFYRGPAYAPECLEGEFLRTSP